MHFCRPNAMSIFHSVWISLTCLWWNPPGPTDNGWVSLVTGGQYSCPKKHVWSCHFLINTHSKLQHQKEGILKYSEQRASALWCVRSRVRVALWWIPVCQIVHSVGGPWTWCHTWSGTQVLTFFIVSYFKIGDWRNNNFQLEWRGPDTTTYFNWCVWLRVVEKCQSMW